MGNYRQHITFGATFGVIYSGVASVYAGLHWAYATVAVLLSTLGGLLPDLDSPSGVSLRSFTGILGVLTSLVVWRKIARLDNPPGFEYHLWAMFGAFILVRHGIRRFMIRVAVHRGMSHSIPTGAIWGALTYLNYPSEYNSIRAAMAIAVMLGFLSHLLLDEICSVDLQGARVNKAFGTALKLWGQSAFSTIFVYLVLSLLVWKVTRVWPDDGISLTTESPAPAWPYPWPETWIKGDFSGLKQFADDSLKALPGKVDRVKKIAAREFDGLPEDLARLKNYAAEKLPKAVGGIKQTVAEQWPEGVQKARKLATEGMPMLDAQVKKIAGERLSPPPSRPRR